MSEEQKVVVEQGPAKELGFMEQHFAAVANELHMSARNIHDAKEAARVAQAWNALVAIEQAFGQRTQHINEQTAYMKKVIRGAQAQKEQATNDKEEENHPQEIKRISEVTKGK